MYWSTDGDRQADDKPRKEMTYEEIVMAFSDALQLLIQLNNKCLGGKRV
jgi:hypothetical protein